MIPLAEIERARERIRGAAVRTPLVRLPDTDIWLKLENLQPVGSFKIRGATNAIRAASPDELAGGVVTASAGNMAQGVAWAAREAGVPATIVVPDHAPQTKLDAIERLGGRVIKVPFERWWQTIVESRFEGVEGRFVHPVRGRAGDGRQRHDRAGAGRGPARRGHRARAFRRRRAVHRDRERGQGAAAGGAGLRRRPGARAGAEQRVRGAASRSTVEYVPVVRRRLRQSRGVLESMWPYVQRRARRRLRRLARGDRRRRSAARRARPRDRRGRRGARARGRAVRPRRRREDRVHRLRRQHRRRRPQSRILAGETPR